jgi:hypothetical protein
MTPRLQTGHPDELQDSAQHFNTYGEVTKRRVHATGLERGDPLRNVHTRGQPCRATPECRQAADAPKNGRDPGA